VLLDGHRLQLCALSGCANISVAAALGLVDTDDPW
jgi:hypothetical protein